MLTKITWLVAVAGLVLTTPLAAQERRVEVSAVVGWTFSDGVWVDVPVVAPGGIFDRIDPKDSSKWGLTGSVYATENFEIGFQYGRQDTRLEASGTSTVEVGDLRISTYHGFFGFNFFDEDSTVRPYAMFGLGATNFGPVEFNTPGGGLVTVSNTQFSTTWGAGVKFFPSPGFGIRTGVQWTPTYIKTDAAGWWCDPWWGCYMVGNSQYSHQWDLNVGVIFRF